MKHAVARAEPTLDGRLGITVVDAKRRVVLVGTGATVGNCCVKKFIGLPSDKIFQAVKRVRKDSSESLNAEAIAYAFEKGWINEWERDFYSDIMRKRKLSQKQARKKEQVNERIAQRMQRAGGQPERVE